MENYELFEEHRENMTRGGVTVYVSKALKYRDRKDLNIFDEGTFESRFIEISLNSKHVIIGEIYM